MIMLPFLAIPAMLRLVASKQKRRQIMARSKAKSKTTKKKAAPAAKPTGGKADFDVKPLPAKERTEPRDRSLRAQAMAKMQKGGITLDGAVQLCREFDKERGKKTSEDTVGRRGYELIRLVAISNGYGAKMAKDGKITTAA
jgi:hypothetical protein